MSQQPPVLEHSSEQEIRDNAATAEELAAGLGRFYRLRLAAADLVLNPWRWRADAEGIELAKAAQNGQPWFSGTEDALAWVDDKLGKIVSVLPLLYVQGRPEVWQIADHLGTYMVLRKPPAADAVFKLGLASAKDSGDDVATGLMYLRRSTTLPRDSHETLDLMGNANTCFVQAGHTQGRASAHESIGTLLGELGRLDEAESALNTSYRLHQEVGNARGSAFQVRRLAEVYSMQGRFEEARDGFLNSYERLVELDPPDVYQATRCAQGLVRLIRHQGGVDEVPLARMIALQALSAAQLVGSLVQEASVCLALADLSGVAERRVEEVTYLRRACELLDEGHPITQEAKRLLEETEEVY